MNIKITDVRCQKGDASFLLDKKQTAFFLKNMKTAAQKTAQELLDSVKKDTAMKK